MQAVADRRIGEFIVKIAAQDHVGVRVRFQNGLESAVTSLGVAHPPFSVRVFFALLISMFDSAGPMSGQDGQVVSVGLDVAFDVSAVGAFVGEAMRAIGLDRRPG